MRDSSIAVDELALRRPTLDDAFLALTGHPASAPDDDNDQASVDAPAEEVAA